MSPTLDIRRAFLDLLEDDATFRDSVRALVLNRLPADLASPAPANDTSLLLRVAKLEARPLTVAQAARVLGVAQKTVRRRIKAGTLAHTRTGSRVVVHLDRDPAGELARAARSSAI